MRKIENKAVGMALIAIVFVVSLPLMVNYCINGVNVSFYLRQLEEGGAENLFFLLPSLITRMGISAEGAYKLTLLGCNVATALIAYCCFKGIFSDRVVGLVGSMIYSWVPYRLNDLYGRGDLGEALAMTFFPIFIWGLYRVYTDNVEEPAYKRLWVFLTLGYTLILQSYLLCFVIAAGFTLLVCAVNWKKTFQKATLLVLLKTVLATGIVNAWTFLLLLYRFKAVQFPFGIIGNGTIQSRGVYLSNFLQLYFTNGSAKDVAEQGMVQLQPLGLGFVVTFSILVGLWMSFTGRYNTKEEGKNLRRFVGMLTVLGLIIALMTTNSFPWDWLQRRNGLFYGLVACLYEPTRLMPLAAVCLTTAACAVVWKMRQWEGKEKSRSFLIAVVVIAFWGTQYLTGDILRTGEPRSLHGVPYAAEATADDYELINLDISPLDYAKYEGSRYPAPALLYAAETLSVMGGGILVVLIWRRNRVEKV